MFFYRHPDNRAYAGKLKTAQKGRHLKAGVFIFGATEASQQKQQEQIRALFKNAKTNVKYFKEPRGHQKRAPEDREVLQEAARYCRTADATFVISSMKGFCETKWQALSWMVSQAEMHNMQFIVADDPAVSRGSVAIMALQSEERRHKIAKSSKEALDNIKRQLAAGKPIVAKRTGRLVTKLGVHDTLTETQQTGNEEQARLARERDKKYLPDIEKLQALGMGYNAIARQFNAMAIPTPAQERKQKGETAGEWYASTVRNIVLRNRENLND